MQKKAEAKATAEVVATLKEASIPRKVEFTLPPGMTEEQFKKALEKMNKPEKKVVKDSAPVVFQEIDNGHNKLLRVHRTVYKEKELLGIQNFWRKDESEDWEFGKAVTFDYELIQDIITGLEKMKAWCEDHAGKE